jgi:hypothetical protein
MWMKYRGMIAVMLLCTASMLAQTATPTPTPAPKMDDHAACSRKDAKMECCKKSKGAQSTEAKKDCCKQGKCARDKKDAPANKS